MSEKPKKSGPEEVVVPVDKAPRIQWNTASLKSTYANVCNATSTREEVVLNFGSNSNWDRAQSVTEVDLEHRIVMSPFVAKRMSQLLAQLMADYEARFGSLEPQTAASPAQPVVPEPPTAERPH